MVAHDAANTEIDRLHPAKPAARAEQKAS